MPVSRTLRHAALPALLVGTLLATLPAQAAEASRASMLRPDEGPTAGAMVGDLVIARPLGVAATAVGTAAFIVALPFTLFGGNVGDSAEALVAAPAKATFARCLGCTKRTARRD